MSQIVAQKTKVNLWEFVVTKLNIMFFVVPNSKYLALFVDLILDLEYTPLDQSVFLLTLKSGLGMSYHMTKPYIFCNLPSRVYIPPLGIIYPPADMSSNTQQLLGLCSKMANPVTRWLPRCMSATLQFKGFTPLSKTACTSTLVGIQDSSKPMISTPLPESHHWTPEGWGWVKWSHETNINRMGSNGRA